MNKNRTLLVIISIFTIILLVGVFNIDDEEIMLETGLPVLTINTDYPVNTKEKYINGSIHGEEKVVSVNVKGHGNTSWDAEKQSYTLKTYEDFHELGLNADSHYVLVSNYYDKSLLRNYYAYSIGSDIFTNLKWTPSCKFVELVLNGEHLGTYLICDQVKFSNNGLNKQTIDHLFDDLNLDGQIDYQDGGFIVEVDSKSQESELKFNSNLGLTFTLKSPMHVNGEVLEYIGNYVQNIEDSIYKSNYQEISKIIDIDSFVDWYLINEFVKNVDSRFVTSVYMYFDPEDALLHIGPIWDYDLSCGNLGYSECEYYEGFWIKDAPWIAELFKHDEFIENVKARWEQVKKDLFDSIEKTIKEESEFISESAKLNFKIYPVLGEELRISQYESASPKGYEDRITYESEVDYLINWLKNRYEWLDTAINNL